MWGGFKPWTLGLNINSDRRTKFFLSYGINTWSKSSKSNGISETQFFLRVLDLFLRAINALVKMFPIQIMRGLLFSALHSTATSRPSANAAANLSDLYTWWQLTGEINTKTPVEDGNVRQSHLYSIQVVLASESTHYYDSFAYATIPRNGNGDVYLKIFNLSAVQMMEYPLNPLNPLLALPWPGLSSCMAQM